MEAEGVFSRVSCGLGAHRRVPRRCSPPDPVVLPPHQSFKRPQGLGGGGGGKTHSANRTGPRQGNGVPGLRGLCPVRVPAPCHNLTPPPPCLSYANVHNYYGPYAYCSFDKGVAYTRGGGGPELETAYRLVSASSRVLFSCGMCRAVAVSFRSEQPPAYSHLIFCSVATRAGISAGNSSASPAPSGARGQQRVRFASPQLAPATPAPTAFIGLSSVCQILFSVFAFRVFNGWNGWGGGGGVT